MSKFNKEKILKQPQKRFIQLEKAQVGEDTLDFSFSSELPVERWYGKEILLNTPEAVDLSRNNGAMPWLWNHNSDTVLGVVQSIEVKNNRCYCTVRWSSRAEVQGYRKDVEDGILSNVSFAYSVDDCKYLPGTDEVIVTRWTPYEISLVPIPADHTVGIGRSKTMMNEDECKTPTDDEGTEGEMGEEDDEELEKKYKSKITKKPIKTMAELEVINIEEERKALRDSELGRIRSLQGLGKSFNMLDLAERLIERGSTLEEARGIFLDEIATRGGQTPLAGTSTPVLGFSKKEEKEYSILRGVQAFISGDWNDRRFNSFEKECHNELAKRMNKSSSGLLVPVLDWKINRSVGGLQTRDPFNVGNFSSGGALVQTTILAESFIDALRSTILTGLFGAKILSGLQGDIAIPKQLTVSEATWMGENQRLSRTGFSLGQIPMSPTEVGAIVEYTRKLLLQSSVDIEQLIRNDLINIMARAIDKAIIAGSGIGNEPLGLLNNPNVNVISLGTNGGNISYPALVSMLAQIESANAVIGQLAWMMHPLVKAKLMLTPTTATGIEGNFILGKNDQDLLGYRYGSTTQIPRNLTKGSASNLSSIILGVWDQVLIGEWGVLEILPNMFGATFDSAGIEIRVIQNLDIAFRHTEAFSIIKDVVVV